MTQLRIAVFSDIHDNIIALNRVLHEIEKESFDVVYCLGDLVGYGPRPNEVIETMKNAGIQIVMGN